MGRVSEETPATIAVMGATGSGKTTFINLVSGTTLQTSSSLRSCTSSVTSTPSFTLSTTDGTRPIVLIDTPGFDDTTKSDSEILTLIGDFLASSYAAGTRLTALLFLHRISDQRMGGISLKTFRTFKKLAGPAALPNVLILTTMWSCISSEELGERRERELMEEEDFFKPALDKGAKMRRHDGSLESAREALRSVLPAGSGGGGGRENGPREVVLEIQREMVDEGKSAAETAAADEVEKALREAEAKQREEADRARREMEELAKAKEEQARKQREEEARRRQAELDRIEADRRRIAERAERERQDLERRLREQEEARRRENERIQREAEERLAEERRRMEEAQRRQREECERLQRELEWQRQRQNSGGCAIQ